MNEGRLTPPHSPSSHHPSLVCHDSITLHRLFVRCQILPPSSLSIRLSRPLQPPASTAPPPASNAHQASNVVTSACWKHSGCAHHICRQLITAHPTPRPRFPYEEVHSHLLTVERAGGRKSLWSQRGLRMHARYDLRWLSQLESRLVCVKHASSPYPVVQCRRRDIGRAAETC